MQDMSRAGIVIRKVRGGELLTDTSSRGNNHHQRNRRLWSLSRRVTPRDKTTKVFSFALSDCPSSRGNVSGSSIPTDYQAIHPGGIFVLFCS